MTKNGEPIFGPQVIALMIPHRPPFQLVDQIDAYDRSPEPRLRASCLVSINHEIFRGHFPGMPVWPGTYTQEGLGQSCLVLSVLYRFQKSWEAEGGDPEDVILAFRNLDLGFRLRAGYRPEISAPLFAPLGRMRMRLGISAAVDMKFLAPVFPGRKLDYDVRLAGAFEEMLRFDVEASVEGKPVARGSLTSAEISIEQYARGLRFGHEQD